MKAVLSELKNRLYDFWFGIETASSGKEGFRKDSSKNRDSTGYMPTPYGRLEHVFKALRMTSKDVFVDIGSGKGRAVFFAAHRRIQKAIGIEIDPDLCNIANQNLSAARFLKSPVSFVKGDAAELLPPEGTVYFLFNPFGPETFEGFAAAIQKSLLLNPRKVRVVYYAPSPEQVAVLNRSGTFHRAGIAENERCLIWESGEM